MGLAESVLFLEIGDLFGIFRSFEFFKPIDPILNLFSVLLFNSREELAAISVV